LCVQLKNIRAEKINILYFYSMSEQEMFCR